MKTLFHATPEAVAKRAVYLAYQAQHPSEDELWAVAMKHTAESIPGIVDKRLRPDLFENAIHDRPLTTLGAGQVAKQIQIGLHYDDTRIIWDNGAENPIHHPWTSTYPTLEDLLLAAVASLNTAA